MRYRTFTEEELKGFIPWYQCYVRVHGNTVPIHRGDIYSRWLGIVKWVFLLQDPEFIEYATEREKRRAVPRDLKFFTQDDDLEPYCGSLIKRTSWYFDDAVCDRFTTWLQQRIIDKPFRLREVIAEVARLTALAP